MKRITVKLSASGVREAVRELAEYRANLERNAQELVRQLADIGAIIALVEAGGIHMTGALQNGIHSEYGGNTGFVKCTCGYAAYVEFGTGIKGSRSPHPDPAILGWSYDVNGHGELGWWYPSGDGDTNPTRKRLKDGTYVAWTKGMPSRPFMYNTAQQLRALVIPTAKGVFT